MHAKSADMRQKVYTSNVETLKEEGRRIMDATIDSRYYNRVAAVNAVLSGVLPSTAAEWFGMTGRSLSLWVKKADEQGFESLRDRPRPGAPKRLSDSQIEYVDRMLQGAPSDYGCQVWDGPNLSAAIKRTFGVELGTRQCQRLFHKLGYSKIRPQTFPSKDAERTEERESFQKKSSNRRR